MNISRSELILIRHGPTAAPDRLNGRTDVALSDTQPGVLRLAKAMAGIAHIVTSPAKRCVQTSELIWGQGARASDPRLWEQDFGAWDGLPLDQVPDIGALEPEALTRHTPPEGESFLDVCARVAPAVQEAAQTAPDHPLAIVAHAGVVRAALAMALNSPAQALLFEVAPLSVTRLRRLPDGGFSIIATNGHPT